MGWNEKISIFLYIKIAFDQIFHSPLHWISKFIQNQLHIIFASRKSDFITNDSLNIAFNPDIWQKSLFQASILGGIFPKGFFICR